MSFWKNIIQSNKEDNKSTLHESLIKEFPSFSDKKLIKIASISGLLSVVAFNDFVVTDEEATAIEHALKTWTNLSPEEVQAVRSISVEHAKELVDLENHIYSNELNELMSVDERYYVLESLFEVAASDGTVSSNEAEQIRSICKGLRLSNDHFLGARATVFEKLGVLR